MIKGSADELKAYLGKNPREWYRSTSRGWVRIKEMHANHLRNAILKLYRQWLDSLSFKPGEVVSNSEFYKAMEEGPKNVTLAAMIVELKGRPDA